MNSFKGSLIKNILISGGYAYLAQAITFLSTVVLSRLLTPSSYGTVGLITVFTNFILVFSEGGLSFAIIRSDWGRTYQKVLTNLSWILGLILFLITILLAYPISLFFSNPALLFPTMVLAFNFPLKSLSLVQGAVLSKKLEFGFIGQVLAIATFCSVCITILMAFLKCGLWSLIIPQLVLSIITAILYEGKVKMGFSIFRLPYLVVAFKYTKTLIGSVIGFNTVNYWARNSDNLIIGKSYGPASLGIYNRAYTLLALPLMLITGLFSNILFPSLKKLKLEGGDVQAEYFFVLRIICVLTYPIVMILVLWPGPLVLLFWGKNWLSVATLLPYFGLLVFTQTLLSTTGQIMILQGKEKEFMFSGWVSAAMLISSIFAGSRISLVAVAQFYSIAYILGVLAFSVYYIYIRTLTFNTAWVVRFWVPKIILSTILWLGIYLNYKSLEIGVIVFMLPYLMYESRLEIKEISAKKMRFKRAV